MSVESLKTATLKTEALVTTYLEMLAPAASRGQKSDVVRGQSFKIEELKEPNWKFNRDMYFKVGEKWKWIDKRPWTDQQWKEYANHPRLRTFAGYVDGKIVGYFELKRTAVEEQRTDDRGQVEIAYFGLLPEFIGRGFGASLLTSAIENAWAWSPTPSRVWVHTCNRDHPGALANYQARGFKIYKVTTGPQDY